MTTTLTRLGSRRTLLYAIGAASMGSMLMLSPIAADAHASGGTYVDNQSNNEGKGQGGSPTGAPVSKPADGADGGAPDIRSTQGIVRGSIMSHPGNLALPHVEGKTSAGIICSEAKCG